MKLTDFKFLLVGNDTIDKLLISALIIAIISIFNYFIRFFIKKKVKDSKVRYNSLKVLGYVVGFCIFFLLCRVWFVGFHSIATFLGLLSAGIAIALKDIMLNIAGWIYIIWKKPFVIGQRIQVGADKGDVIDIRTFVFTIMELGNWVPAEQSTGRMVHIPNGIVFTQAIHNYESGFSQIFSEVSISITFESNWEKAKGLLQDILERIIPNITPEAQSEITEASNEYFLSQLSYSPTIYTNITETGVRFDLRYLCHPRERRLLDTSLDEEILRVFSEHSDINFAHPTTRFYDYTKESKQSRKELP